MKNTLLFIYSTNILVRLLTVNMKNCLTPKIRKCALVTLLKMWPHYSQSNCENATSSGGTFQLASYKEVPPLPWGLWSLFSAKNRIETKHTLKKWRWTLFISIFTHYYKTILPVLSSRKRLTIEVSALLWVYCLASRAISQLIMRVNKPTFVEKLAHLYNTTARENLDLLL